MTFYENPFVHIGCINGLFGIQRILKWHGDMSDEIESQPGRKTKVILPFHRRAAKIVSGLFRMHDAPQHFFKKRFVFRASVNQVPTYFLKSLLRVQSFTSDRSK
jgi:hypothetical protein